MIIKLNWGTGGMTLDLDRFFPTTVKRANAVLKLMRQDVQRFDWHDVRDYFTQKMESYSAAAKATEAELGALKALYFENGYWYGDCVYNEKKAKALEKEINQNRKNADLFSKYIDLFNKQLG